MKGMSQMLTVTFLCLGIGAALCVGEQVHLALRRAGIAVKEAAYLLQVSEPRLYAFFRNESPMDIRRLDKLPPTFHDEFDAMRVQARGGTVLNDARIARLVDCVDDFQMAKAELLRTAPGYTIDLPLGQKERAS